MPFMMRRSMFPKPLFEYWKKRDPIARLEDYLV